MKLLNASQSNQFELDGDALNSDPTRVPLLSCLLSLLRTVMHFPFTFKFSVPGLHNPFTAAVQPAEQPSRTEGLLDHGTRVISRRDRPFPPSRFASPSPSLVPLTRKRAWVPSIPEPSHAATSAASICGYLDTPAKYRYMVHEAPERETEEMFGGVYPPPRRVLLLVWRALPEHAQTMWFLCFAMHMLCTRMRCRF